MIKIFTPSFADYSNINAQNLTVKQIVSRLDPKKFHVTLYYADKIDFNLQKRPNTVFLKWYKNYNTILFVLHHLFNKIGRASCRERV